MYTPHNGRWLSEDPAGFVDGPNTYLYVGNSPTRFTDPSGEQPQAPMMPPRDGRCCACDMAIDHAGNPQRLTATSASKRTCVVQLYCAVQCPNNLLGSTSVATPIAGINQASITICISCRVADASLASVIAHELVHAQRFCNTPGGGISNCETCRDQEKAAYEISCKLAFPKDSARYKRCVECGMKMGCAHRQNRNNNGPCTVVGDCKAADLGVALKPDPVATP